MSDEQGAALQVFNQVFQGGEGDGDTVVSAGASSQLVKDHEGPTRGVLEDVACVPELHLQPVPYYQV